MVSQHRCVSLSTIYYTSHRAFTSITQHTAAKRSADLLSSAKRFYLFLPKISINYSPSYPAAGQGHYWTAPAGQSYWTLLSFHHYYHNSVNQRRDSPGHHLYRPSMTSLRPGVRCSLKEGFVCREHSCFFEAVKYLVMRINRFAQDREDG